MGFFTGMKQASAETTYKDAKKYLKSKDGKIHVIILNYSRNSI